MSNSFLGALWGSQIGSGGGSGDMTKAVYDPANKAAQLLTQPDIDTVQLKITGGVPAHSEGLLFYDNINKTPAAYVDESDITLQIGQEVWIRVKNNTGSTITNGQVVFVNGNDSGIPTIALADASALATSKGAVAIATHDIETATIGICTRHGVVRGLNTNTLSAGDVLYLSTTAGAYTTTEPESPDYSVRIGICVYADASDGQIDIDMSQGGNTKGTLVLFNGAILESHVIDVTSNGTVVTLSIERSGGGDLSLFFDGGFSIFDTSPAATVTLTAGSDVSPTLNYIYIPKSTKVLTVSTVGFTTTEQFVPVATVMVQSAASAQTYGLYKVHAWTDHLANSVDQGHLSHLNKWIRYQHATWLSGIVNTLTPTIGGGTATTVHVALTSGVAMQLHTHAFPAFNTSTGSKLYVVNDSVTAYKQIQGLIRASIDKDSAGDSLDNRRYNIVLWGIVSEDAEDCQLMINLPSGSYGTDTRALQDANKTTDFSIPSDYKGCGFLIAQIVLRDRTSGSSLEVIGIRDLRGSTPVSAGGGAGTTTTEFADNTFHITNVTDSTKELEFDVSGVTTETIRTLSIPDRSGEIAIYWNSVSEFTTTAASTSTITITSDMTGSIYPGMGIKFKLSGSYYFAIVAAITSNLLTIAGAPLTTGAGDLEELYYTVIPSIQKEFVITGAFADATNTTLLATDLLITGGFKWKGAKAYLVNMEISTGQDDSSASTQPTLNATIAGTNVFSTALTIPDGAYTETAVAVTTANYDINESEILELSVVAAITTPANDAMDLFCILTFVPELS